MTILLLEQVQLLETSIQVVPLVVPRIAIKVDLSRAK
jgi:hypothetical protein